MEYQQPVQAGDKISATKINKLLNTVNEIVSGTGHVTQSTSSSSIPITILNEANDSVSIGQPMKITGMRNNNVTREEGIRIYRQSGIQLKGTHRTSSSVYAIPIEGIPENKIGRCLVSGIFASSIYYEKTTDTNFNYADIYQKGSTAMFKAVPIGDYHIIGVTQLDSERVGFGYLVPATFGHLVGVTQTDITGNGKTNVTITGYGITVEAGCPLLNGTIKATSTVILSKNRMSNTWQIVEVECPDV